MPNHHDYLIQALSLAAQRRGFCAPNPAVGAVVVKEGTVLATGSHWAAGHPHAEVIALNQLTEQQSEGASIYVSLEPCSHTGRTPPCVEFLIKRKLKQVFYAYQDPNPLVAGKGEQGLQQAGIPCARISVPEIDEFYQSYHYWSLHQRPWVTAKIALSLDGKIAGADGQPLNITGPELQTLTQQWRKHADAILTTVKTINNDDPQLNSRLGNEVIKKPVYILDRNLSINPTARIFHTSAQLTLFYQQELNPPQLSSLTARGLRCVALPLKQNQLDLTAALSTIGQDGVQDLWVEAGGLCFQSLVLQNLLQRVLIYIAPVVFGQAAHTGFTQAFDFSQAKSINWRMLGQDMLCEILMH